MNQHDLLLKLIQQLLSYMPGGPLLSGLVASPLASWMSPSSSMSNAYLWPGQNQSMHTVAYEFMDTMRRQSFGVAAKRFSNEQQIRALTEYHRMLNPNMGEKELRGLAENSADNFFDIGGMLYSTLDPYKLKVGLSAASDVASILHRRSASIGLRGAEYAHSVSKALMGTTNESGEVVGGLIRDIIDNPGSYGNMSVADVMAVGKEIALTDKTGFMDTSKNTFKADEFKKKVQQMSRALEPWKDIFGKDVPEMLNQLEALTGSSIGASNAADIQSLGNRMMSILGTTGAKIQHIAAYKDALSNNLIDSTMTNRSILGASAIAGEMTLGLANLGVNHLTSQELQSLVGRVYSGTGGSKFSDRYALAYAKWAEDKKTPNDDEFRATVTSLMASGMSNTDALLKASGATSLEQLEAYRNTDNFLHSVKSGGSQRATMEAMSLRAAKSTLSFYTSDNFSAYNGTVKSYIEELSKDPAKFEEFFGLSTSEKVQRLKSADSLQGLNLSNSELMQIVADLEGAAGSGLSVALGVDVNRGQATGIYAERSNYRRQNRIAKEQEAFNKAVGDLMVPGGFSSMLSTIRESGGKANVEDLIKSYAGGSDMLEVLLRTEGIDTSDKEISEKQLSVYKQGINFARNNYSELPGEFKPIYDLMMGRAEVNLSRKKQVRKGYRLAAELNALGQAALDKMTPAEQKKLLEDIQNAELKDDDDANTVGRVARDKYIDTIVGRNFRKLQGTSEYAKNSDVYDKMAKDMIAGNASSVEQLKKDLEKDKKFTDAEKKAFADLTKGIGDIDGTDPLQTIAKALEKLPELINDLITAFSGGKPKPGSN